MRNTVVFILRLLVNDPEAEGLHGILRNVLSGEEQAFSTEQGLLELLRHQSGRLQTSDVDQFTTPPRGTL